MKILFIIFILSAAAMDSENAIISGIICLSMLLSLLVISNRGQKERRGNG